MITNVTRCASEFISRIAMATAVFSQKNILIGPKFKEETCNVLHLEHLYTVLKLRYFGKKIRSTRKF
jgi:hypothetical protein